MPWALFTRGISELQVPRTLPHSLREKGRLSECLVPGFQTLFSSKHCLVGSFALQKACQTHKRSSVFSSGHTSHLLPGRKLMGRSLQTQPCRDTHPPTHNCLFLSDSCFLDSVYCCLQKQISICLSRLLPEKDPILVSLNKSWLLKICKVKTIFVSPFFQKVVWISRAVS